MRVINRDHLHRGFAKKLVLGIFPMVGAQRSEYL